MQNSVGIKILFFISVLIMIISCTKTDIELFESGVSNKLATLRDKQLTDIKYNISFQIPNSIDSVITGHETIEFNFSKDLNEPLLLDFRNPISFIKSVKVNNKSSKFKFENEHIIIPNSKLKNGRNQIKIDFISGNRALNRNKEYLYTLFVPDRACTAFPCFDQPSLKAKFQPVITVPIDWTAVTNSPLINKIEKNNSKKTFIFEESDLISTYLFSFVVGQFKSITKLYNGKEITMYHRENDSNKLTSNIDKIFDLHYKSIDWLEDYTKIKYPFKKFDFILIPSFQYSGMEHPGAILYKDTKLFLENNATIREELDRANLIAHETAHIWFGDLVTMEWFSEVWLKEVFANFMAGKIVNPQYPQINHKLNFLINHYPASYNIDRTTGANPIEQELNNMKNAGTLYGSIIYHKAPIVMQHLENSIGENLLKEGLQEYLNLYKYNNATWDELISILDSKTDDDMAGWSKQWIYEPGMPDYSIKKAFNDKDKIQSIIIEQSDPYKKKRQWSQNIEVLVSEYQKQNQYNIELKDTFNVIELDKSLENISYIFPNTDGLGYGYFKIDSLSKENILTILPTLKDPVLKCAMYISLWENMLHRNIDPQDLFNAFNASIKTEKDPQNINLLLGYIESIFWKFIPNEKRVLISQDLEEFLWKNINADQAVGIISSFFNTYRRTVITSKGVLNLYKIWNKDIEIPNLTLSEKDFTEISFELALRNFQDQDSILKKQYKRITDTERKERFLFIKPAVSVNMSTRDLFFENLKVEKNREKEPWVIDALRYLHHPLQSNESVKYIYPSLMILEELQSTGDIFFPKQWLDAIFWGHSSIDAVLEINLFLNENPDFPSNLKSKILQSTDLVFRSSIIRKEEE